MSILCQADRKLWLRWNCGTACAVEENEAMAIPVCPLDASEESKVAEREDEKRWL